MELERGNVDELINNGEEGATDARIAELEEKLYKTEKNFKSIAKQYNELKANAGVDVNELVNSKIAEVEFYNADPVAKEFKSEIKAVQDQYNLPAEQAFLLWKAQNNKISPAKSEGVEGVEVQGEDDMSREKLMKLSGREFLDAIKANPGLL